jgi:hypothetical protein
VKWIFSVRYAPEGVIDGWRRAVVGLARESTVEAALALAKVPEEVRQEIRAEPTVRNFIEGKLDPEGNGHYVPCPMRPGASWIVCIGPVQMVIS